jgi:CRISPR-associated protein Cmr1
MIDLVLEVTNSTPMLTGWYSPELVDPQGLRVTEVKGVWRWWARAVIGGALYDECMLVGESRGGILKRPRHDEIRLISCMVGKILGLGYATREGAEASRFTLKVETLTQGLERRTRSISGAEGYQRMKLLSLGGRTANYIPEGATFRVTVDRVRTRYDDAEDLAVKILVLALQLMGVGKGSRRGLGSLDLTNILIPRIRLPGKLRDLLDEIYSGAVDVVKRYARECSKTTMRSCDKRSLPPMPVVSRLTSKAVGVEANVDFNITSVYLIQGPGRSSQNMFVDVHNFFVRSERCRRLYGNPRCNDPLRDNLEAWILGLPRSQRGTGYEVTVGDVDRRASPIIVSYHSGSNRFGGGVFATFILSVDWPREMEWTGGGGTSVIRLNEVGVVNAMSTAFNEFRDYVVKSGYSLERVWP